MTTITTTYDPKEWKLVPVEPTKEIREALRTGSRRDYPSTELCNVRWAAAINIAHTPPTGKTEADKLIKALEVAKDALQKLSCLGNGERPGNSVGNSIAQEAIATINELGLTK